MSRMVYVFAFRIKEDFFSLQHRKDKVSIGERIQAILEKYMDKIKVIFFQKRYNIPFYY